MRTAPFYAKDMSLEARKFLYACAFWAVAADEQLKPAEQEWLVSQFGAEGMTKSLDEFVALESSKFVEAFDDCARALSDDDKRKIYPGLEEWLLSCLGSDSDVPEEERKVIAKIKDRLMLKDEIERICGRSSALNGGVTESRMLSGHTGEVTSVEVSDDGKLVLSGSEDGTVRLWDFAAGSLVKIFKGHESGVGDVCFCGGGRILSGDRFGKIRLWSIETGKAVWKSDQRTQGGITGLAVDAAGKRAAFSSDLGLAGIFDLEKGQAASIFGEKKRGALHDVDFSRDGRLVLTGGDDKTVRIWDAGNGSEKMLFEGHEDGVMSVCFNADGSQMLSGSRDNTVRLWSAETGEEMRLFKGHTFSVYSVCFSPDGLKVMSAGWDHMIKIWNARSGTEEFSLEQSGSRFSSAVFHPGGRHIVAGGSDKSVHIFSLVV